MTFTWPLPKYFSLIWHGLLIRFLHASKSQYQQQWKWVGLKVSSCHKRYIKKWLGRLKIKGNHSSCQKKYMKGFYSTNKYSCWIFDGILHKWTWISGWLYCISFMGMILIFPIFCYVLPFLEDLNNTLI